MRKIKVFLSSAMNGELDSERLAIRVAFSPSNSLADFYRRPFRPKRDRTSIH